MVFALTYNQFEDYMITWSPIVFMALIVFFLWRTMKYLPRTKPQEIKPSSSAAIGWDEIAFHTNATLRTDRGFDQNRAFGGVGRMLGTRGRIEAGYLRQYLHSVTGPNRMNHALATTMNVAF